MIPNYHPPAFMVHQHSLTIACRQLYYVAQHDKFTHRIGALLYFGSFPAREKVRNSILEFMHWSYAFTRGIQVMNSTMT